MNFPFPVDKSILTLVHLLRTVSKAVILFISSLYCIYNLTEK